MKKMSKSTGSTGGREEGEEEIAGSLGNEERKGNPRQIVK